MTKNREKLDSTINDLEEFTTLQSISKWTMNVAQVIIYYFGPLTIFQFLGNCQFSESNSEFYKEGNSQINFFSLK